VKIFYGVQGTGNGHITRARAIAQKFKGKDVQVDWLFTGRPKDQFFEMEAFGDYQWRAGLTFATSHGHIQYIQTALRNNLIEFIRDIRNLDLSGYDLVVTDFEPVTAWAAKMQGIKTVGIGHQYAFGHKIPIAGNDVLGLWILKYFAPATVGLGVHWHHFNGPILPPIIETKAPDGGHKPGKIIVYLPFEDVQEVITLLKPHTDFEFHVYNPGGARPTGGDASHIQVKGLSRHEFQKDFSDCAGVITNAGFELPSESLHMGKKLLVKPLHGQVEQLCNALALAELGLADVMHDLDTAKIESWLAKESAHLIRFPDVPAAVVDWLMQGKLEVDQSWIEEIWDRCERIN